MGLYSNRGVVRKTATLFLPYEPLCAARTCDAHETIQRPVSGTKNYKRQPTDTRELMGECSTPAKEFAK